MSDQVRSVGSQVREPRINDMLINRLQLYQNSGAVIIVPRLSHSSPPQEETLFIFGDMQICLADTCVLFRELNRRPQLRWLPLSVRDKQAWEVTIAQHHIEWCAERSRLAVVVRRLLCTRNLR